ncbi:DUF3299 domain-containing protein [Janthinobacterium sp. PC23-8]|uniref:DUF3299 domain-containing protein n=1 Tax=Janthinobacterium sp. PC23-8 TaxID=2012679 RepID=UPI000B96997C|nr:DUF3299 domain-containing protein [Janthinobacterium sp. PC23-8]OYO28979.1 hypothetical protein CD932_17765 [Janthinobacterium sp. PC23-8]
MKSLLLVLLLAAGIAQAATHVSKVTTAASADQPPSFFAPLGDLPGVLPWSLLSKAATVKAKGGRMVPKYTPEITALDQTDVKVQGFMMPLQPGQKQKHFLLTVTSASCPFCLPAGPEGVVEINSRTPVKFTYAPMVMTGKMTVLKSDPMGLYYRINDASLVAP